VAVHPPLTPHDSVARRAASSGQATPRHPPPPAYRCYLPVLTGFAGWRRAGPGLQRCRSRGVPGPCVPRAGIGPA